MRFFENSTVFNYSWEQVVQGFWRRYPNPDSKHVLSEDTISRESKLGKLISKRLIRKNYNIPNCAKRFINTPYVCILEESIVDLSTKTLVTYTRNLGLTKVMNLTEKVIYKQSEESPLKTVATRYVWIESPLRGFSRIICAFGYERSKKDSQRMVKGFNYVLQKMFRGAPKNASGFAKSKAAPIYATIHSNQS